ncbi:MAG: hypothetical protein ACK53Y_08505, partial [bacterium]
LQACSPSHIFRQNLPPVMLPRQRPSSFNKRNTEEPAAGPPAPATPPERTAPTKEKELNSPEEEEDDGTRSGGDEADWVLEEEGIRRASQSS